VAAAEHQFEISEVRLFDKLGLTPSVETVEVQGGRARALITGQGAPVVLLPGGGMPAAAWLPLMRGLHGFQLIALELPGFGLSSPVHLTADRLHAQAVSWLAAALDGFGLEQPAVIANSMGALWTFWLALDRPERAASIVTIGCPALILGTSAPAPMRVISNPVLGRLLMSLRKPSPQHVQADLEGMGIDLGELPELRDLAVALHELPWFRSAWLELLHAALTLRGARAPHVVSPGQLCRIRQPCCLIWGDKDPFGTVTVGQTVAKLIPRAELHVLDGGHAPGILPRADAAAPLVQRFLEEHDGVAGTREVGRSRGAGG
jgi:pimeloyl-ACP methyl ester carboxylesterase